MIRHIRQGISEKKNLCHENNAVWVFSSNLCVLNLCILFVSSNFLSFLTSVSIFLSLCSGGSRISRRGAWTSLGGCGLPRRLRFENFVCQNERIWTLGGCALGKPPLDPPMLSCLMKKSVLYDIY